MELVKALAIAQGNVPIVGYGAHARKAMARKVADAKVMRAVFACG